MKTNAVRLLDALGVRYELREYEIDPDDLAAESVAVKIGMPPEQVFKTLLARGDRSGPCFADCRKFLLSRLFRINWLGGNCSQTIESNNSYTYPILGVGVSCTNFR